MPHTVEWNKNLKLIISDVDETIADLYVEAMPEMIEALEDILAGGAALFLISGQSIGSIQWRITNHIRKDLRKQIIVGHSSGAEVWGFDESGDLKSSPFYSLYETALSDSQKQNWRDAIQELI